MGLSMTRLAATRKAFLFLTVTGDDGGSIPSSA
jgi:hypothetical protein